MSSNNTADEVVTRKRLTKEQAEDFFGHLFFGKHHSPEVKPFGVGWRVNCYSGDLATWDFNYLTRLVFLAHDKCIRVEIVQGGPGRIGISIWQRQGREGDIMDRHPTIETALAEWRAKNPGEET